MGIIKLNRQKKERYVIILVLLMFVLSSCDQVVEMDESISDSRYIMGTIINIQLFGTKDQSLLEGSYEIIEQIEQLMSLTIESSMINEMNQLEGHIMEEIPEDMLYVLKKSIEFGDMSGGKFDISLEPVITLWGIGTDNPVIPSTDHLENALSRVDYRKIELDLNRRTLRMPENMSIDLGGIGKGFAADQVAEYLKSNGVKKAILNLGGNILVLGGKSDVTGFRVGVQDPYGLTNEYFGIIDLYDKALVTSGIYERNFSSEGVLYHHILDVQTGYPVDNGVAGITVITEKSIDADGLSTVLFLEGVENGLKLVESLEGVECLFVTKDKKVFTSSGLAVEIVKDEFILSNY